MKFKKEKMKELVHYIFGNCGNNVKRELLFNLIFFSDLSYYKSNKKSITNEVYKKYPNGPLNIQIVNIIQELLNEGKISEISEPIYLGSEVQLFYNSSESSNSNFLNRHELETVNFVISAVINDNISCNPDKIVYKSFKLNLENIENYSILNYNDF